MSYGLQVAQLESRWVAFCAAHPVEEQDGSVQVFKRVDEARALFDAGLVEKPAPLSRAEEIQRRLGV